MKTVWIIGAAMLMLFAGCGGRQETPEKSGPPALMSVTLVPEQARVGEQIEARVDLRSYNNVPVALSYQWLRNGVPVPEGKSRTFNSQGMRKGNRLSVRVQIQGQPGAIESPPLRLANTPPKIASVAISPERPALGQPLTATVQALDSDGDPIRYRYRWSKGEQTIPSETTATLPGSQLARGDQGTVEVMATDGEDMSEAARSRPVTVSGHPPVILSQPPSEPPQGGVYTYQIVSRDPDGGPVVLSLISGPPGMTLDPQSGLLSWRLPQERGAAYSVVVRATDQDGVVDQNFTIRF